MVGYNLQNLPPIVPALTTTNVALVIRIMRKALPADAKLAKDAQECMQQCVSEFVSFIASEGMVDSYIYVHQSILYPSSYNTLIKGT